MKQLPSTILSRTKNALSLRIVCACALLNLTLGPQESAAQSRNFGLGVMIGEPTGISAKLFTANDHALDFGLGWAFTDNRYYGTSHIHMHVDYVWHARDAIKSTESLPLYYGVGGRFTGWDNRWDSDGSLAVRGVFGIAWLPRDSHVDVFLEVAPSLRLTPGSGFALDAAFGARYFF